MSLVKFFKTNSSSGELNLVQDNLIRTLNPVFNTPILGGNLLTNIPLVTGSNTIDHKLGRNLVGWIITRQRSSASFYDNQQNNANPSQTLLLVSSAPVIVDIYVF